jgi:2-oxoacid dehydrogenases acyltransferase (catalytic domain).
MFSRRSDGHPIKVDPYSKIPPHVMSKRSDAMNFAKVNVRCESIDAFIKKCREENNVCFSYLHVLIAAMVRLMAERKALNRFVNVGRIYQRDYIDISFVIKKALKDDAYATAVKLQFYGNESIYKVKEMVDAIIKENSGTPLGNRVDKTAKVLACMPNFALRFAFWGMKKLDRWNMLPKSLIKTSPFHTSCFITNMKSIKADYIYHHCYDFGTTGIFIGMGKEQMVPVVEEDKIVPGKVMTLGIVTDERFCDGLYYANSTRLLQSFFKNPSVLLDEYHDEQIDKIIAKDLEEKKQEKK